ncbi:hypothetical protein PFAG_02668 [Plasmodium falciparum Santa Lucia]|uniref:Uncharacterized protein n=3 Tax=Plasmodium falciparum TaxID=5833 RepID=W7F161_PLAF8|nr:hypothetical protein PFNF135_06225 [Plasmodium falciparum NF135/5.C10]EUR72094.1 hypothetical protein PFBG_02761 [Plasmodium falciparum 7G8]EUT85960.1 hypothetical protein PFAG_02668 [Plasmodium falciparum Santa Lucia]
MYFSGIKNDIYIFIINKNSLYIIKFSLILKNIFNEICIPWYFPFFHYSYIHIIHNKIKMNIRIIFFACIYAS